MEVSEPSKEKQSLPEDTTQDPVFGEITEEGPNYRNVGFWGTVVLMMKTQIGLGVLSIPTAFDTLGMVPGVLCLCAVAVITTWSDYMIGAFKLNHREVYGIDDVGALIFGPIGRAVLSVVFCLLLKTHRPNTYWIFNSASGILGLSIGLNAVSSHGACTAIFVAISAIVGYALASIRTLGRITWLAWIGLPCILTAIFIVVVAVGVQDRPSSAPQTTSTWVSDYKITASPSVPDAISAVSSIVFAFSGTPGFFSIVSEMRNPAQYTRALLICQSTVTAVYVVIGVVLYYYCGSYVASPALGSAGGMVKKISYGFALPGLIVTMTIVTHIPAKFIFVHLLRGSRHLSRNTPTHWLCWLGCTLAVTVIAYIIASAIPVFNSLISLIGALFGTVMCFQTMGCMWLYDNWGRRGGARWYAMAGWSVVVIGLGMFLMVGGTYGTVLGVLESYRASGGSSAFSCADNSGSD